LSWRWESDRARSPELDAHPRLAHALLLPSAAAAGERSARLEIPPHGLLRLKQVHGAEIISWRLPTGAPPTADGIVLRRPGEWSEIRSADCVPLVVAAAETVALVHGGWRGTLAGIAARAIERLDRDPATLSAVLGPHIGVCCYLVGEELARRFERRFGPGVVDRGGGRAPHLDLARAVERDLIRAGVRESRIHHSGVCTCCDRRGLPSWRREGEQAGRMRTVVGLRSRTGPASHF